MADLHTRRCDDLEVRFANETAGARIARGDGLIVLHNHAEPCHMAERLDSPRVARLGAEVAPRPDLKRFCKVCGWPTDMATLHDALRRTPERYR